MIRLYISGTPTGNDFFLQEEARRATHRLFSLHGNYLPAVMAWLNKAEHYDERPTTILLDSGAFTAWNKGHRTTVEEVEYAYDLFLKRADGMFDAVYAINLDVIPGSPNRDPTLEEIKEAVTQSDINLKILQDRYGDMILPVFHQGENEERLNTVCSQAEYICVSPRNDVNENMRVKWAQDVHGILTDKKTHGLATTGVKMLTVPWFSVDSATAIHVAAFGMLIFNINSTLRKIFITKDSDKHKLTDKHIDTLPDYSRDLLMSMIKEDIFTLDELRTNVKKRVLFNVQQLTAYTEQVNTDHESQMSIFGV